jgi:hypothetical protein
VRLVGLGEYVRCMTVFYNHYSWLRTMEDLFVVEND